MILRIRAVIYKGSWHRPFKNQWFFNDFAHPGCYLQGIVASTLQKPIVFQWFCASGCYLQGIVASTLKKPMVFQWFCASGLLFTRDRGIDPSKTNGFSMILRIRAVIYKGSWHRPVKNQNGFWMILRIRAVIYKGSWHRPVKNQWFFNDFAHPGCYLQGIVASTRKKPMVFEWFAHPGCY